jgi:hypothetical protein
MGCNVQEKTMDSLSILILMKEGVSISWYPTEYYGPFSSPEERDAWILKNPAERGEKWQVQYLSK